MVTVDEVRALGRSDLRFSWAVARLAAIDHEEMTELVLDAWRMVVPQKVWRAYALTHDLPITDPQEMP